MLIDFSYRNRWLLVILMLGFFLFAYKVGDRDLWAPDEDEYAQVSREIIQLDNWAYPTVNQKPYTIKPVLYNWLISFISLPWGDVNEYRARIFSSLAAIGTIVCIFYLGCLMFSNRAGFLGALILGTGVLFIQYGRWVQINMLATFFVMLTLFLFYRGYVYSEKRRSSYLLMYIPIGLGILTMGPVNLVLPALVIGLYLLMEKDLKHLRELELGWGILITLVIVAPYFLLVSLRGEYSLDLLVRTNFTRYFDTWTHKRPFYYYLPNLCWAFLPWTLLLPGSLQYAFSNRSREKRKETRFLLVWAAGIFLFFSFSQCKRIQYILPLFPALALLVAYLGDQAITNWKDSYYRKMVVIPSVALFVLFALSAVGLPVYALMFQKEWLWEMIAIGIILAAVSLLFFWALKKTQPCLRVK
jgi:4-amino-4-deoxy-L-arabinose transferase-like glycosyltransferase